MSSGTESSTGTFSFKRNQCYRLSGHLAWTEKLERSSHSLKNMEITEVQRSLPGDTEDLQSRYIEAIIDQMVICCLYLPNGNPYPGPKFDYKLSWIKRLKRRTNQLITMELPAILIGDFNIIPEPADVYKPERWENDALYRTEVRKAFKELQKKAGWILSAPFILKNRSTHSGIIYIKLMTVMQG